MLPDVRKTERLRARNGGTDILPGSWWRLNADSQKINIDWLTGFDVPDHGVILMIKEVRVIDGDIHTIILRGHPAFRHASTYKILCEEFLSNFTHEPNGAELRESELSSLMVSIGQIAADISAGPTDQEVTASLPAPAPILEIDVSSKVPVSLLPGGDVVSAQARIERGIAVMKAKTTWISTRTEDMKLRMRAVSSFHEEKVDNTLAGISAQTRQAEDLLRSVHTMRLWLGEGVEVHVLSDGASAPAAEPLHLMQRLLFLDEEIYVESLLHEGFSSDNMHRLPDLIAANPALVDRMLPYPRSVAISRVRRESRDNPVPQSWSEIFAMIEKDKQDKHIQILIRDGDRVLMVMADEETSNAQRLFPSRSEIDAIFSERSWSGGEKPREITPQDIEYSDKRSEHDKRALFYKRFLLILWGLSEREGVFGPFIPEGTNWLEETAHHTYFRFVHDEENVLTDGRQDVISWMADRNAGIQSGSHVLVHGDRILDDETAAPGAWKNEGAEKSHRVRSAAHDFELQTVQRRSDELICRIETLKRYSYRDNPAVKTTVILSSAMGQITREGFICLDRVSSADLRHYIESRINRRHYLKYLGMFHKAMTVVMAREAVESDLYGQMIARGEPDDQNLVEAVRMAVGGETWMPKDSVIRRIPELARRIRAGVSAAVPQDVCDLRLTASGALLASLDTVVDPALATGFQIERELTLTKSGCRLGGPRWVRKGRAPAPDETMLRTAPRADQMPSLIRSISDMTWISRIIEEGEADLRSFLDVWERPSETDVREILMKSRALTFKRKGSEVLILRKSVDLGVLATSNPKHTAILRLIVNPMIAAARMGYEGVVRDFCSCYIERDRMFKQHMDRSGHNRHLFLVAEELPRSPTAALQGVGLDAETGMYAYAPDILSFRTMKAADDTEISAPGSSLADLLRLNALRERTNISHRTPGKISEAFSPENEVKIWSFPTLESSLEPILKDMSHV